MFPITEFTKCLQGTMTSANLRIFLALLQSFLCIRHETTTRGLSRYCVYSLVWAALRIFFVFQQHSISGWKCVFCYLKPLFMIKMHIILLQSMKSQKVKKGSLKLLKSLILDIKITHLVVDCAYSGLDYLQIALDNGCF